MSFWSAIGLADRDTVESLRTELQALREENRRLSEENRALLTRQQEAVRSELVKLRDETELLGLDLSTQEDCNKKALLSSSETARKENEHWHQELRKLLEGI